MSFQVPDIFDDEIWEMVCSRRFCFELLTALRVVPWASTPGSLLWDAQRKEWTVTPLGPNQANRRAQGESTARLAGLL